MNEQIIRPWLLYLINFLENLSGILAFSFFMIGIVVVCLGIFAILTDECESLYTRLIKWLKRFLILFFILGAVIVLIPSKNTMYSMLIADQVTYENVDKLGDSTKDTEDYIFDRIEQTITEELDGIEKK